MNERDKAYVQILHFGLLRLRDAAELGKVEYCAVEAEHLHNIPSLIGEPNEGRHDYYIEKERGFYLERVDRSIPGIDFTLRRYAEPWQQIEAQREHA